MFVKYTLLSTNMSFLHLLTFIDIDIKYKQCSSLYVYMSNISNINNVPPWKCLTLRLMLLQVSFKFDFMFPNLKFKWSDSSPAFIPCPDPRREMLTGKYIVKNQCNKLSQKRITQLQAET